MVEHPKLLAYPDIPLLKDRPELNGVYCYIIKDYKPGISCLISINKDHMIQIGDWHGNPLDINSDSRVEKYLREFVPRLLQIMQQINIHQIEVFISESGKLVDAQLSVNKFIGPGMLRDIFNNTISTQDIVEIAIIDENKINQLKSGYIIKPSKFRFVMTNGIMPMYARI